jgi:hypothetical protein
MFILVKWDLIYLYWVITQHFGGAVGQRVQSFKFLSVHITTELSWSAHSNTVMKNSQQCLFTLRRLNRVVMGRRILKVLQLRY